MKAIEGPGTGRCKPRGSSQCTDVWYWDSPEFKSRHLYLFIPQVLGKKSQGRDLNPRTPDYKSGA